MASYAIGDVQGCYTELCRLLERLAFDPRADRLWFVGDIVNRGPDSLAVLRFVKALGERAVCVLGNHDLHLLAVSQGNPRPFRDDTLEDVLRADDADELIDWLRRRPLMHHDGQLGFAMLHAGLPPQWDLHTALALAGEVETVLRGDGFHDFCMAMYGNEPRRWSDDLRGMERLRFITNCFSRLRFCTPEGELDLRHTGPPGTQQSGQLPWFSIPQRATRDTRIVFGHWSTLGYCAADNVWALDSGCLWGGRLTALRLAENPRPLQISCPGARQPHRH
jgi:bis(5'-nucleosyl)-tetraphosphatase (symmetrical)